MDPPKQPAIGPSLTNNLTRQAFPDTMNLRLTQDSRGSKLLLKRMDNNAVQSSAAGIKLTTVALSFAVILERVAQLTRGKCSV